MFDIVLEISTSELEVGLVKYRYDEQLAVILAFLVRSLVSKSAVLDKTFGYSKQGAYRGVSWKFSFTCERCGEMPSSCRLPEITGQIVQWTKLTCDPATVSP